MVGRLFKVAGLMGGGILALGTGALGTHLAHPTLEKNFFPERINEEKKLRESLDNESEKLDKLSSELVSQERLNSSQELKISNLFKNIDSLNQDLSTKSKDLETKINTLEDVEKQLFDKIEDHKQNANNIALLNSSISQKDAEITSIKQEKAKVEQDLTTIESKLKLRKEDILKSQHWNMDLLNVNLRKIEFKSFVGEWAEFEITVDQKTITFKVHKEGITNHEQTAKDIRSKGITFGLSKPEFQSWDKEIKITKFDVDYEYKVQDANKQRCFVKSENQETKSIKITDYFNDSYLEEAFKIYFAIEQLDNFPLRYNLENKQENLFHFSKDGGVKQNFLSTEPNLTWEGFKATEDDKKMFIWTHRFETVDDFIRYWISKTIDFIRTGTVDLFDFLNPVARSHYYQNKS